jgi:hypothetical protein
MVRRGDPRFPIRARIGFNNVFIFSFLHVCAMLDIAVYFAQFFPTIVAVTRMLVHLYLPKKESRASLRRPVVRQHTRGAGHERNAGFGVGLPDENHYSKVCRKVK